MEAFVIEEEKEGRPSLLFIHKWMEAHPGLSAGFSSRHGGVSDQELNSLNCALHVQDAPANVLENRKRLAEAIGFPFGSWTCAEQVHGKKVTKVTAKDRGKGKESRELAIQESDGLTTDDPGTLLTAFFADCVPLYFFDPVRRAVALSHAGWKGTAMNIAAETIQTMRDAYGSRPKHILCAIGPSIGQCCYEVDRNVAGRVEEALSSDGYTSEWTESDWRQVRTVKPNGKVMLNLKEANRQFMIKAGILPTNIEISGLCTSCNTQLFFSHRKEHGKTGRMTAWIALSEVNG
ncbi:peptidoglycan editing factor PgeF [Ferviditalea candida]|uniref:Purine nucleoside phosphorylase n=1 Tax=Ferviditalea candida TaxID=3108399 RepID=A0ABU5ZDP1_9BACL|nr:peptidoglycan editing factor PgeF [Paenibacillaceae bacterium T2]